MKAKRMKAIAVRVAMGTLLALLFLAFLLQRLFHPR